MRIKVHGFHRFNPRKDLKSMPWLRLENDFYDKEDFFDEDVNATWLFIFLLCQCAQKVSNEIELSEKYLISKSKLTKKQFFEAISRLKAKSLISFDTNESDRISSDSYLTNERTERTERTERSITHVYSDALHDEIVDLWNRNVDEFGLPKIKSLNAERKKKLKKACDDFSDIEDWKKIFTIAATKGFIGKDGREFVPNWDYVFRNNNYFKFYEEYDLKPVVESSEILAKAVESLIMKDL